MREKQSAHLVDLDEPTPKTASVGAQIHHPIYANDSPPSVCIVEGAIPVFYGQPWCSRDLISSMQVST